MLQSTSAVMKNAYTSAANDLTEFANEVHEECVPSCNDSSFFVERARSCLKNWIHIPYFPAFHRPGWLVRYVVGPYDTELVESLFGDLSAGLTVSLTLIPQALSYATLANLPPINGLYAAVLPSACYTFFGSSMQLAVGPVAIVSLLVGTLVNKYVENPTLNTEAAIDTAAQASLCCGIILSAMALLNMGDFINFLAHPVMSGFTSGAACTIGLNQMKSAFGMSVQVPQAGQPHYEFNYQVMDWWSRHFNNQFEFNPVTAKNAAQNGRWLRNHYAVKICFGLFVPLFIITRLKQYIKSTPERKKTYWFRIWNLFCSLMPFIAIIIGANVAWRIKHRDHYNSPNYTHAYYAKSLSIVGIVKPGLDILRSPNLRHPWGQFFVDVIPLTLIAFMESYSVSRRIATQNNQLHILNASQEIWANGVANLLGCISSAYPVSGSFSRSSLNQASGAKTPLSKAMTLIIVIFALLVLTRTFQYIPQAALAAVIWSSIFNLINIGDFWEAWKHSKKDFLIMLITFAITFIFDTSIGLAVGIGFSLIVYLIETTFSGITAPLLVASSKDNHGIDVVKLEGDLTFLSAARVKDFLSVLTVKEPSPPDVTLGTSEYIHRTIGQAFDRALRPHLMDGVKELPKALVVDMAMVRLIDLTGIQALVEVIEDCRKKGILVVITYAHDDIQRALAKMGVENDASTEEVNLDDYLSHKGAALLPVVAGGHSHSNSLRNSDHSEEGSKDKGDEEESKLSTVAVDPQRIDDREIILVKASDDATHKSNV